MPEKQKCECVGWTEKKEEEESLSTQVGRLSRASPSTVAVLVQQVLPGAGKNVENRLPPPLSLPKRIDTGKERLPRVRERVFSGHRGTAGAATREEHRKCSYASNECSPELRYLSYCSR